MIALCEQCAANAPHMSSQNPRGVLICFLHCVGPPTQYINERQLLCGLTVTPDSPSYWHILTILQRD